MTPPTDFTHLAEAAKKLGYSVHQLRQCIKKGMPHIQAAQRGAIRVSISECVEWMRNPGKKAEPHRKLKHFSLDEPEKPKRAEMRASSGRAL